MSGVESTLVYFLKLDTKARDELIQLLSLLRDTHRGIENRHAYKSRKARNHKRWTRAELIKLAKMVEKKWTIQAMALELKRTKGAVMSRISSTKK